MPTPRFGLAAVTLNGKVYAIGGTVVAVGAVATVEVYDPSANTWSTAAPMPTARSNLAAAVVNGKIYAIGGNAAPSNAGLSTVEVYDPVSNTWSTAAAMPTARSELAAAAVNGQLYAVGGCCNSLSAWDRLEIYNPATNTWLSSGTPIQVGFAPGPAPMLTPRVFLAAVTVNGKIYTVGGGIPDASVAKSTTNAVEVYDPATNTWSTASVMPTPRYGLTAATVNGKIYAIGGTVVITSGTSSFGVLSATVEVYDPTADTWATAASMLSAQSDVAASDANGLIYVVGDVVHPLISTESFSPPVTIYTFIKN